MTRDHTWIVIRESFLLRYHTPMSDKPKFSLPTYIASLDKRRLVGLLGILIMIAVGLWLLERSIDRKTISITGQSGTEPSITNQATATYCTEGDATCSTTKQTATSNTSSVTKETPVDPGTSASICLATNLQLRSAGEMDHGAISVTVKDTASGQVVAQAGSLASDASGKVTITDANVTRLLNDSQSYDVAISMLGYVPRVIKNVTNILTKCVAAGTFLAGDANGDGAVRLNDLILIIRYYNGSPTAGTTYIFKGKRATLSMLIAVIRNYNLK